MSRASVQTAPLPLAPTLAWPSGEAAAARRVPRHAALLDPGARARERSLPERRAPPEVPGLEAGGGPGAAEGEDHAVSRVLGLGRVGRRALLRAAGTDPPDRLAGLRAHEEQLDRGPARSAVDDADEVARDLEVRRGRPVQPRLRPPERAPGAPVERLHDPVGGERDDAPPAERQALATAPVDRVGQGRRPRGPPRWRARGPRAARGTRPARARRRARGAPDPRPAPSRRRGRDPSAPCPPAAARSARGTRAPRPAAARPSGAPRRPAGRSPGSGRRRRRRAEGPRPARPARRRRAAPGAPAPGRAFGRARTRRRPPGGSAGRSRPRSPSRSRGRGDGAGGGARGRPRFPSLRC